MIEKSQDALFYLMKNAENVKNVKVICGDINNDFDLPSADVVISNPPYIKTQELDTLQSEVQREPRLALDGGFDGLDFYRIINQKWYTRLKKNGTLFLEIGNEQGEDIKSVLTNFDNINIIKDIYGNDRMVSAVLRG